MKNSKKIISTLFCSALTFGLISFAFNATPKTEVVHATTISTIADILPAHFPTRTGSTVPENAWVNDNGAKLYVYSAQKTTLSFDGSGISAGGFMLEVGKTVTASDDNYTCPGLNENVTITFKMSNGKLSSVVLTGYLNKGVLNEVNGEYKGTIVHTSKETYDKVEPTCTVAGHEAYYECDCGAFFSDSTLTNEIQDIDIWLAEGGGGYIPSGHNYQFSEFVWDGFTAKAKYVCSNDSTHIEYHDATIASAVTTQPTCITDGVRTYTATYDGHTDTKTEILNKIEHHYSGGVTYTWDDDQCTATWYCDRERCSERESETVTAVYVKDTDATHKSNEFGHYQATFNNPNFVKQTTEKNSVELENTKLPGLSGGAIAGIAVGSFVGLCLIAYVVMFFIWKKTEKALKFLVPSYKWINKKIF